MRSVTIPEQVLQLTALSGADRGERFVVDRALCRVGKATDNDIVLSDLTVSRYHGEISKRDRGYVFRDLSSTNGSFLDSKPFAEAQLRQGSTLTLGQAEFRVDLVAIERLVPPSSTPRFGALLGPSETMRRVFTQLLHAAQRSEALLIDGAPGTGKKAVAHAVAEAAGLTISATLAADSAEATALLEAMEPRSTPHALVFTRVDRAPAVFVRLLSAFLRQRSASTRIFLCSETSAVDPSLVALCDALRIHLPALQDRETDSVVLAEHFLAALDAQSGRAPLTLASSAHSALLTRRWVTHLRELRQLVEDAAFIARVQQAETLTAEMLDATEIGRLRLVSPFSAERSYRETKAMFETEFERRYLSWLLETHSGNLSAAARTAEMDRKYLHKMVQKYGLPRRARKRDE